MDTLGLKYDPVHSLDPGAACHDPGRGHHGDYNRNHRSSRHRSVVGAVRHVEDVQAGTGLGEVEGVAQRHHDHGHVARGIRLHTPLLSRISSFRIVPTRVALWCMDSKTKHQKLETRIKIKVPDTAEVTVGWLLE